MSVQPLSGLGRSLLTSGAGPVLSQVFTIALVPVLFRLYTPHDFGVWATVQAIALSAGALVSLRYDLALVLERDLATASHLLFAGICVVLTCSAAIAMFIALLIEPLDSIGVTPSTALLGWIWLVLIGPNVVLQSWLTREGAFGRILGAVVLAALVTNLVQLGGGFSGDGVWLIVGSVAGQLAALLFNFVCVIRTSDRPLWRGLTLDAMMHALAVNRRFPQYSLPFTVLSLIRDRAPIFIFSAFAPQAFVGLYSQAWRMTNFPVGLTSAALRPVFFHLAASAGLAKQRQPVDRAVQVLLLASAPWVGLVIFGGDPLFTLLLGQQWQGAGSLAGILIVPAALFTVTNWMDRLLDVVGRQDINLKLEALIGVGSTAALALSLAGGGSTTLAVLLQSCVLTIGQLGFLWVFYGITGWPRAGLMASTSGACALGALTFLMLSMLECVSSQLTVFAVGGIFASIISIALLWRAWEELCGRGSSDNGG